MITNLFSVFDPSSSIISTSWLILILATILIPINLWNTTSSFNNATNNLIHTFNNEVSFTLNNNENSSELIIMSIFTLILTINFLALYPQIFSPTSHLTINLPLSLTFWLALMIFGWMNNTNHMLSHLLPQGTPGALIIFIVIIELVSNLIRPITLCVRLTANLIAGHLLMSLLGNALINAPVVNALVTGPIPITLTILESAVACIQAYVFITLITLYTTEVN